MKTKLLKKVRKQYSIVYYPNTGWYKITHPHSDLSLIYLECFETKESREDGGVTKSKTYHGAVDKLLKIVRSNYSKYTRKYKMSKINYKVWYNK